MIGRKMAKSYLLEPYQGLLLASAILLPIGVYLTYKAARDSKLFEKDVYLKPFQKIFGKNRLRNEDTTVMQ